MKTLNINPQDMLPLTPAVFHILLALTEGERHGYAIMREVAESTHRQINMGPGTLYGTIKRLLEAGLIEESDRRPDCLTGLGQRVVEAEASRYNELAKLARRKRLLGKPAKTIPAGGI